MDKFIQFHTLTSYSGVLLNRDDAGFAKTLPFGNATRTRISSQCLKYHWRSYDGEDAIRYAGDTEDLDMSVRSRLIFKELIARPLIAEGYPAPLVRAATIAIREKVLNGKKVSKTAVKNAIEANPKEDDVWENIRTGQVVVFGRPEIRAMKKFVRQQLEEAKEKHPVFFSRNEPSGNEPSKGDIQDVADVLRSFSSDLKKTLKALEYAAGLDAAMFGRMVTSDILSRGDAAVHVAHAITTHAQQREDDYFTATDQLQDADVGGTEAGAGHVNTKQLTSGIFYSYVVIDVPLLVSNIEGVSRSEWEKADHTITEEVVRRFTKMLVTAPVGAKRGSTAGYASADYLMVESGAQQPRTLANAFQKAVDADMQKSIDALETYRAGNSQMLGEAPEALVATSQQTQLTPHTIEEVASAVA